MSTEDDERLSRILNTAAANQKREEDQRQAALSQAAAEQKARETAKPQIEACVERIRSTAALVNEEVKQAGVQLHTEKVLDPHKGTIITITANNMRGSRRSEEISLTINDYGYINGGDLIIDSQRRGVSSGDYTPEILRTAFLKLVERVLGIAGRR